MKIVALEASNFKRLRAVHIVPDGSALQVISGANGAGKSSVLDAVASALAGARLCPAVPIRIGEDHAEVTVDLGELVVTRRWTASGHSTLTVKNREGFKASSPQDVLNRLTGSLSFDPLAFTREKPKDQAETLRKLTGLDFSLNDKVRQRLFEERTIVNREREQIKGALARAPEVDAPDEEVSVAALLSKQEGLLAQKRNLEAAQRAAQVATQKREDAKTKLDQARDDVGKIEKQLAHARNVVVSYEKALIEAEENEDKAGGQCMELPEPDLDGIRKQLAEAEGVNAKVRARKARQEEAAKLAEKDAEADRLTKQIELRDLQKAKAIADAQFPIPGLGFDENGPTLDGLPLDQASQAQQLRVSIAIGASLQPKLKVLLIRDGSLLDEKSLALVAQFAEEHGLQVWLERVSDGKESGIVIEDGAVAGAPILAAVPAISNQADGGAIQ